MGIAMGNADQVIKAVANKVTDTNDREGVLKALQEVLCI
jgi:hydroxymethylpyrimidine pyrophosphatase-like HAD family hydrolase